MIRLRVSDFQPENGANFPQTKEKATKGANLDLLFRQNSNPMAFLFSGKQTLESLNRLNGFRTTQPLRDIKITQTQGKVSYFYLNHLLQVEFRAIFEPFSYIL